MVQVIFKKESNKSIMWLNSTNHSFLVLVRVNQRCAGLEIVDMDCVCLLCYGVHFCCLKMPFVQIEKG